jgi:hypothetical protein
MDSEAEIDESITVEIGRCNITVVERKVRKPRLIGVGERPISSAAEEVWKPVTPAAWTVDQVDVAIPVNIRDVEAITPLTVVGQTTVEPLEV